MPRYREPFVLAQGRRVVTAFPRPVCATLDHIGGAGR